MEAKQTKHRLDAAFVAEALGIIARQVHLDAAGLAAKAGVPVNSVENLLRGEQPVDETVLAAIAGSFGIAGLEVFRKPSDDDLATLRQELEGDLKSVVLVDLRLMETPLQVAAFVAPGFHALRRRFDVEGEDTAALAEELAESLETLTMLWEELGEGERIRHTTDLAWKSTELKRLGYTCRVGHHRQRARLEPDMVASVGVIVVRPTQESGGAQAAYAMLIRLEADWENLDADRERIRALLEPGDA